MYQAVAAEVQDQNADWDVVNAWNVLSTAHSRSPHHHYHSVAPLQRAVCFLNVERVSCTAEYTLKSFGPIRQHFVVSAETVLVRQDCSRIRSLC